MTTYSDLIRSRATQIGEIRRTGRQDLATNLLRDLYIIADCMSVNTPAHKIADMLSDALAVTAPAPAPDVSVYPYLATFRGQGEMLGQIVELDDRYQFPVSAEEAEEAAGPEGLADAVEFDALAEASAAPAEVKNWSGPFEISIKNRAFKIESDHAGAVPLYADTIDEVRTILLDLFGSDASDHDQAIARPLELEIAELDESRLEKLGGVALFEGVAMSQRLTAQVQDLEEADEAKAA